MRSLYSSSIEVIKKSQSKTGAYIACPSYPTYQYCWLRDGSFIAHAMDTAGEYESAAAFFRWVDRTIRRYRYKVEFASLHIKEDLPFGKDDLLHTRYTVDGDEVTVDDTWGNFQIDGYGTWLWALGEHVRLSGDSSLLSELSESILITLKYLELVWKLPNYDCWEEHPEYLHTYSLSTVYAGLSTIADLVRFGKMKNVTVPVDDLARQVKTFILAKGSKDGRLIKYFPPDKDDTSLRGNDGVDASLIGVSIPYRLINPDDPIMLETVKNIEAELLRPGGGVYRYKADVYYGGGEWILLTAWLGWYYTSIKRYDLAKQLCQWIEEQADENGDLAEQLSDHLLAPDSFTPWVKKWGPIAKPLTWSHGMYIILANAIEKGNS